MKRGDVVFVEGKLEGIWGIVREVSRNFKISDLFHLVIDNKKTGSFIL